MYCQLSFYCYYSTLFQQKNIVIMMESMKTPLSPITKKTKVLNAEKQAKIKNERDKIIDMIDCFYDKVKIKIEKALNKDNKRTLLLCKELFTTFSLHPKQQLFEINQLNDVLFNEMTKINQIVVDCLKSIEALMVKMNCQLNIQKEKAIIKQQKQSIYDYQIAVLRKIMFKKQKTSLRNKLKDIDTLNKKIIKVQQNMNQMANGNSIQIDGKRIEYSILKYKKIWLSCKKREYLLCLTSIKGRNQQGQLVLYNDKLQTITQFTHIPPINMTNLIDILHSQNYIFIIHSHSIVRISLINEQDFVSQLFAQQIKGGSMLGGNIILWVSERLVNYSLLIVTQEMEIFYQEYLMLNTKEIYYHFKIDTKQDQEIIYFISKCLNGSFNLFKVKGVEIKLVLKDVGQIDQVVPYRVENRTEYVLFRKADEFYKFTERQLSKRLLQIDMECGQMMQKCCILGGLFYCLHQSGKYLLQCHFNLGQCEQMVE